MIDVYVYFISSFIGLFLFIMIINDMIEYLEKKEF